MGHTAEPLRCALLRVAQRRACACLTASFKKPLLTEKLRRRLFFLSLQHRRVCKTRRLNKQFSWNLHPLENATTFM